MFYLPTYHRLKDGQLAFLRFPDPEAHAKPLIDFLQTACGETPFLAKEPEEVTLTEEQERDFLKAINSDPCGMMILAEVEGKLAGNCSLTISPTLRRRHRATVGIALYRQYWGLGLGPIMLEALEGTARQKGVCCLELEVDAQNTRAIALYEKLGYETLATIPDGARMKDGAGHDLLLMRKTL